MPLSVITLKRENKAGKIDPVDNVRCSPLSKSRMGINTELFGCPCLYSRYNPKHSYLCTSPCMTCIFNRRGSDVELWTPDVRSHLCPLMSSSALCPDVCSQWNCSHSTTAAGIQRQFISSGFAYEHRGDAWVVSFAETNKLARFCVIFKFRRISTGVLLLSRKIPN